LRDHALTLSVINLPPGDHRAGERGLATLTGRDDDFARSLETGLEYAYGLGCQRVHLLTGNLEAGQSLASVRGRLLRNLERAVRWFEPYGIKVLLEPLARAMLPDYSLTRVEEAVALIEEIGSANLRLQMDLYHTQMEQGNLAAWIERSFPYLDYIQVAGVPGRHEPTVGEINYGYLFSLLDKLEFAGWIGCEYVPLADTASGLAWATDLGLLPQR
jgi:hydroxypyruvate isomerase